MSLPKIAIGIGIGIVGLAGVWWARRNQGNQNQDPPNTVPSATPPIDTSKTVTLSDGVTAGHPATFDESVHPAFTNNGVNTLAVDANRSTTEGISVIDKDKSVSNPDLKFKLNGPYADRRLGEFKNAKDLLRFYGRNIPDNASFITLTHLSGDKKNGRIRELVNVFDENGAIIGRHKIMR